MIAVDDYRFGLLMDRVLGRPCVVCGNRQARPYPDGPRCSTHPPAVAWPSVDRPAAKIATLETPAPEVPMRPAAAGEIPASARRMTEAAESAGWTVNATYARGTMTPKGHPARVVGSLALRMSRGLQRAVGTWEDGKFSTAYAWLPGLSAPARINATALRARLAEPTGLTEAEFAALVDRTSPETAAVAALRSAFRVEVGSE